MAVSFLTDGFCGPSSYVATLTFILIPLLQYFMSVRNSINISFFPGSSTYSQHFVWLYAPTFIAFHSTEELLWLRVKMYLCMDTRINNQKLFDLLAIQLNVTFLCNAYYFLKRWFLSRIYNTRNRFFSCGVGLKSNQRVGSYFLKRNTLGVMRLLQN